MLKILLTGVEGQVGHALQSKLTAQAQVFAVSRRQLDLGQTAQIRRVVQDIHPDIIINPAAYTAVDQAETEPELAYAINASAPQALAEVAADIGAKLIHFSTDYVYSGSKDSPYTEEDVAEPLGVYGKSKLAGERAIQAVGVPHLIFRTSWVYGVYGKNFLKTMVRLAGERESLRVVADQIGAPTCSQSIAEAVSKVLCQWRDETGIYHLANAGQTSWHGFAVAIVEEYTRLQRIHHWPSLKLGVENIQAITTQEYPTLSRRPANSCLDCTKLAHDFSVSLPHWRDALAMELQGLY